MHWLSASTLNTCISSWVVQKLLPQLQAIVSSVLEGVPETVSITLLPYLYEVQGVK